MGEIIWVVVSGTAFVSERGPGRVFGDWEGLEMDYYLHFSDHHGVRGLPSGVSAYKWLGHSVLI